MCVFMEFVVVDVSMTKTCKKYTTLQQHSSFAAIYSFIFFFSSFAISSSPGFFPPFYAYMCSCQDMTAGRF